MRERAAIVRGRLEVRSSLGSGTEIELRVPGATACPVDRGSLDGRACLAPHPGWTPMKART